MLISSDLKGPGGPGVRSSAWSYAPTVSPLRSAASLCAREAGQPAVPLRCQTRERAGEEEVRHILAFELAGQHGELLRAERRARLVIVDTVVETWALDEELSRGQQCNKNWAARSV